MNRSLSGVHLEEDLITKIKNGDKEALAKLYAIHRPSILRISLYFLGDHFYSEDIAQETWFHLEKSINSYKGTSTFKTYLYSIVRNLCYKKIRFFKFERKKIEDIKDLSPTNDGVESEDEEITFKKNALKIALKKLSQKHREPLLLKIKEELSLEEIAQILNVSVGTVKSRIFNAKEQLTRIISEMLKKEQRDE